MPAGSNALQAGLPLSLWRDCLHFVGLKLYAHRTACHRLDKMHAPCVPAVWLQDTCLLPQSPTFGD